MDLKTGQRGVDLLEKIKLDSEFSLVYSMDIDHLNRLAGDYEQLKARMVRELVDVAEKLLFIYAEVRAKD